MPQARAQLQGGGCYMDSFAGSTTPALLQIWKAAPELLVEAAASGLLQATVEAFIAGKTAARAAQSSNPATDRIIDGILAYVSHKRICTSRIGHHA